MEDANASGVAPLLITLDGNASAPVRTTTATVSGWASKRHTPFEAFGMEPGRKSDLFLNKSKRYQEFGRNSMFCKATTGERKSTGTMQPDGSHPEFRISSNGRVPPIVGLLDSDY